MWRFVALLALMGILIFPRFAVAEASVGFREGGKTLFSLNVPSFWTVRVDGAKILKKRSTGEARKVPKILAMVPSVDPDIWVGFYAPPGIATVSEGVEYMREAGRFLVQDPQVTDRSTQRVGGRTAQVIAGNGRRDGEPVSFVLSVIDLPGPRVAIGVAVLQAGSDASDYDTIRSIFSSFRVGS